MEKIVQFLVFALGAKSGCLPERLPAADALCTAKIPAATAGGAYKRPAMLPRNHSP